MSASSHPSPRRPQAAERPNPEPSVYELEIEQWESLVWYVVNRLKPRLPHSVSEDDLYSAGMLGLLKASRSYDPTRGAEFKTYAYHRVRGAMLDELRTLDYLPRSLRDKARQEGVNPPAVVTLPTDEDGSDNLEAAAQGTPEIEKAELLVQLQAGISSLPEKMRMVMHLYYNEGKRMREIGAQLQLTESRVSQIHSAAVARLRRSMLGDHQD